MRRKKKPKAKLPRDWNAVEAWFKTGSGAHGKKGYSRKKKHRKEEDDGPI